MSELKRGEPAAHGVRRIVRHRITHAAELLAKNVTDADVHDARKELKRARAALRLLRDDMGEAAYKRENGVLRDAAHPLSAVRDGKVLLDTVDELAERFHLDASTPSLEGFCKFLRQEHGRTRRTLTPAMIARQRRTLQGMAARSAHWRMGGDGWDTLGAGATRVYRNGRKALAAARSRSLGDLHEWRKQVKYLWHELQILHPIRPGMIGELADQAHKLADYLGDDHDLAVLRQRITDNGDVFADSASCDALLALIDRSREQLQDKAFVLGERIFEEKPRQFQARLAEYWRAWRREEG